jgi:hypothetical protein
MPIWHLKRDEGMAMAGRSKSSSKERLPAVARHVEQLILLVRAQRVLLDEDLARMYGVSTGALVRAVKRNVERFPRTSCSSLIKRRRQHFNRSWESRKDEAGVAIVRTFTEQGVAMLSSVLRSHHAIAVNVQIMRAFVHLRQLLASNQALSQKLEELERKFEDHDEKLAVVFEAIRELMTEPAEIPKPRIEFSTEGPLEDRRQGAGAPRR